MLDFEASLGYTHKVIEHYPDGGTWSHYFRSARDAKWAIEDMQEFHRARIYELIEL